MSVRAAPPSSNHRPTVVQGHDGGLVTDRKIDCCKGWEFRQPLFVPQVLPRFIVVTRCRVDRRAVQQDDACAARDDGEANVVGCAVLPIRYGTISP
jgi:hypothetical protein